MNHFHDQIRIEAPVEHVWAYFIDMSNWEDWMPRRKTSDVSGPLDTVGTTYVQSTRLMGFEMKWTTEVVEVEPQRLIHVHSDDGPMDNYFRFESDSEATRIEFDSDYDWPGRMPAFIMDLMATGWMERNVRKMLEDFKALAEAKVATPA